MSDGGIAARGLDERLTEIPGPELAQAEFGGAEMIDAGRKSRRILDAWNIFTRQIGADDVKFDFVKGAGARCGAKKSLPLLVFLAANDPGGEEQELREGLETGDRLRSRLH